MDLSRKILLASFVSAAFLTIGISCSVEDRDIEAKGVFVCQKNEDCISGSRCVMYSATEGRCVREDQVDHCHDNDKDGFLKAETEEHVNECAFSETNPQDPDDTDPTIYPGAAEYCDNKDNDGDGCVDGTCPEGGDCIKNKSLCIPYSQPCWGSGELADYDNSVCAAKYIGYMACNQGRFEYITPTATVPGQQMYAGGECPKNADLIPGYSEADKVCDGTLDYNCNGMIDENCERCVVADSEKYCFFSASYDNEPGKVASTSDMQYQDVVKSCQEAGKTENDCECLGVMVCLEENGSPLCKTAAGMTVSDARQYHWECMK